MNAPVTLPDLTDLPVWNLDDLYLSRDDPKIGADLAAAGALAAGLNARAGTLKASRAEPAVLGERLSQMIGDYEKLTDLIGGLSAYASLATSVGREDAAWPRFEADMRGKISAILADTLFLSLEINALDEPEIAAALDAVPAAGAWTPWLRRVRAFRDHELSPDLERLFNDRAPAIANWVRLYDDTLGALVAKVGPERLTLPEVLNRLSDPLPGRRKAAAQALAKALGEKQDIFVLCLNTLAAEKATEDGWRRYPNPAAARHLANETDPEAVAAMETAVVESYGAPTLWLVRGQGAGAGVLLRPGAGPGGPGRRVLRGALDRRAAPGRKAIRRLFPSRHRPAPPLCVSELSGRAAGCPDPGP